MTAARSSANGHRPEPPHRPVNWAAHYQPTGAPLRTCARAGCGAKWIDDEPGRQAHIAVFGHSPKPAEPAKTPKETTP
jgi:hypothetical protein